MLTVERKVSVTYNNLGQVVATCCHFEDLAIIEITCGIYKADNTRTFAWGLGVDAQLKNFLLPAGEARQERQKIIC